MGMLLFSNLAGRWGDRAGHLKVVSILSALGTLCVVGFVFVDSYPVMCLLVFSAGATFASMSPVALALIGVVIPSAHLSRANSFYNTFYAGGMLVGPLISSLIFARFSGQSMLYHLAALWSAFVLFCVVFYQDDPAGRRVRSGSSSPVSAS
jgi:MFS family permease